MVKVRIWDIALNDYAPPECVLGFLVNISGNELTLENDQYIIEQYAGLKDIFTDKECCENDLIDWYDRHKDKVIRFKVAFKDGTFVGIPIDNPNMSYQLSILLCRTMHSEAGKIIGNIHEVSNAN